MGDSPDQPLAVLDAFPDAVLLLARDTVTWANARAQILFARGELSGVSLRTLLGDAEHTRIGLLQKQRAAGWQLPETCRVSVSVGQREAQLDLRFKDLPDGRTIITARDATEATRAERLIDDLAERANRAPLGNESALFDAVEPIFLELGWVVAFTRVLPQGSRVERIIAPESDPVGVYGRSLLGKDQPRSATPVLQQLVTTARPLFLDNLPTASSPPLAAQRLSQSMADARVARNAWYPIFTPDLSHVLAVTGRGLTEHDFAAIGLFAAQVGASIRLASMQRDLVRNERLAAIGETASVLAHELRTPLGVVFNVVSALRKQAPESHALVRLLEEEADRLQRLVTDLLDFGRVSPPHVVLCDANAVATDALEAARHLASWRAAHPTVQLVPVAHEHASLRTDCELFRRALLNLLTNAAQHVAPGGTIKLTVSANAKDTTFEVWNQGPPLTPEVAARVFEPFFTTREDGTGLGLAITRRLCTELGGVAAVVPTASGVAFHLSVPRSGPR